jgi:hypothetical protein
VDQKIAPFEEAVMRPNPHRGRVYRRCACRDSNGSQLGTRCPKLTNPRHGTWAFAVDRPPIGTDSAAEFCSGGQGVVEALEVAGSGCW